MPERILIVRLGSLGDLVHTLPAVAAIRRAHPQVVIDWLVDAVHREFLALVPVVSSVISLRDRTLDAWLEARRALRANRYDVAMDFQGLIKSAALARLSGARRVVGFDRAALRERAAAAFYSERVPVSDARHVIRKNLELAAVLGATAGALEFPIDVPDSEAVRQLLAGVDGTFAVINPGAAWPNKRWPPDHFAAISRILQERHGLRSVVLWGPGEQEAADAIVNASAGAARLAPPTGLRDLVALARAARLFVSGDTGPLHIAAALGVPVVALFGPTNPARNGPWDDADVSVSRFDGCECLYERRCRRDRDGWCLGTITVDEVAAAIATRLGRSR